MKLERKGTPVQIGGATQQPQGFAIANSRIAFNILSSGLYNDKILACIRELSCNAYDAHVAAGKREVPFEIHLPTSFEPFFSVKDNGTGLRYVVGGCKTCKGKGKLTVRDEETDKSSVVPCSKCAGTGDYDAVRTLYTTYFASDKNESNDFVGAMGLGSKSPFCYTEGFTITNRYNGTVRVYTCVISEAGTPAVVPQTVEPTDDPNGVEVMFPVKQDDCWEFENKAKVALEFFNPKPILNVDLDIPAVEYVFKTAKWGLRKEKVTHQTDRLRAVQGMVQYAVGKIDVSKSTSEQQSVAEMPLDLFFNIGELAVAASRESLQLDVSTVANILKELDAVYTGMLAEVRKKLELFKTAWEARVQIYNLIAASGALGKIVNDAYNRGQLDGQYTNYSLNKKIPTLNELDYSFTQIYRFQRNWRSGRWAAKSSLFHKREGEWYKNALAEIEAGSAQPDDFVQMIDVDKSDNIIFIINDLKFGGEKYIHYFLQEAKDNIDVAGTDGTVAARKTVAYTFSRAVKGVTPDQVMVEARDMLEKLGNPPVLFLSNLKTKYKFIDERDKVAGTPVQRDIVEWYPNSKTNRYGDGGGNRKGWTASWKKSEQQPAGVKYYVTIKNLNGSVSTGFEFAEEFRDFIQHCIVSGHFGITANTVIYGLKTTSKLRENKKEWVEIVPHLLKKVKTIMTPARQLEMSLVLSPFECDWDKELSLWAKSKPFRPDSPMQKFVDALAKAKRPERANVAALEEVLEVARARNLYKDENIINFTEMFNATVENYPMLQLAVTAEENYNRRHLQPKQQRFLEDYINLCDNQLQVQVQSLSIAAAATAAPVSN